MQITTATFIRIAGETVPGMRRLMADIGVSSIDATPSIRMTATVPVDGVGARVRVTVELDPDDDDEDQQ